MENNETNPQAAEQVQPTTAEGTTETMPSPEDMLKAAELKAQEHYDA